MAQQSGYGAPYGTCVYGTAPDSGTPSDEPVTGPRGGQINPLHVDDEGWQRIPGAWGVRRLLGPLFPFRRKPKGMK